MSLKRTIRRRRDCAKRIARERGGWWLRYYLDATWCHYAHGASPENYFVLRFFELGERERRKYLTSGRSKEVDAKLNRDLTERDRKTAGNKWLFDRAFADVNRREFLYVPEADEKAFADFVKRHGVCFLKPCGQIQGKGIRRVRAEEIDDFHTFWELCRKERLLAEEEVRQHPAVAAIHPSSVNTLRIVSARTEGRDVCLVGAALRCGCGDSVIDNFHGGGIAYPVSPEDGRVCAPGRDHTSLKLYEKHPDSGIGMIGFAIPFWDEIKACVQAGMDRLPSLRYAGWDIAVTEQGPEILEVNYSWPGGNIIQFDGIGKYDLVCRCLEPVKRSRSERGEEDE